MKLVIRPDDGTITVETPDDTTAAQFVRELLSGHVTPPAPKAIESKRKPRGWTDAARKAAVEARRRKAKNLAPARADRPISKVLDETWAWMAASDRREGITVAEVAEGLGLTPAAAAWRIARLRDRDMAWAVTRGYYRVGSLAEMAGTNGAPR